MPKRSISISAKCSDMFSGTLRVDGKWVGEYSGYVPSWFPNPKADHDEDYVQLDIDVDTGQILNWKKPTEKMLKEFLTLEEKTK